MQFLFKCGPTVEANFRVPASLTNLEQPLRLLLLLFLLVLPSILRPLIPSLTEVDILFSVKAPDTVIASIKRSLFNDTSHVPQLTYYVDESIREF